MTERSVISKFKRQKLERTQKKRQKRKLRDNNSIGATVQKRRQPSKNLRDNNSVKKQYEKFKRQEETKRGGKNQFTRQ